MLKSFPSLKQCVGSFVVAAALGLAPGLMAQDGSEASGDRVPTAETSRTEPVVVQGNLERARRKWARVEARFGRTGESKQCVYVRHLKESSILDDQTIFFKRNRGEGFLMTFNRPCPGLFYESRFTYRMYSTQLCHGDVITVLDGFGRGRGSCSLKGFELMTGIDLDDGDTSAARLFPSDGKETGGN